MALIIRGSLLVVFFAMAWPVVEAFEKNEGGHFHLEAEAIDVLTQNIFKKELHSKLNYEMPDILENIGYGVSVAFSGNLLKLSFEDVLLRPQEDGGLRFSLSLRNLEFLAQGLEVKRRVLFKDLSAKCQGLKIQIGQDGSPLKIETIIRPELKKGALFLSSESFHLSIDDSGHKVVGPKKCDGLLGTMVQSSLNYALSSLIGGQIRSLIEEKFRVFLLEATKKINQLKDKKYLLEVSHFPFLVEKTLCVGGVLKRLQITEEGLKTWFSLEAKVVKAPAFPREELKALSFEAKPLPSRGGGSLALSYTLFNSVLNSITKQLWQAKDLPLELHLYEDIKDLFLRENLQDILPDLVTAPLESEQLKAILKINQAPSFSFDEKEETSFLALEGITLELLAKREGKWRPYFEMIISSILGFELLSQEGHLKFAFTDSQKLSVQGRWGAGYAPKKSIFDSSQIKSFYKNFILPSLGSRGGFQLAFESLSWGGVELFLQELKSSKKGFKADFILEEERSF